ncbi:glycosyltransferase family 2 protein [Candidatus Berkelbacteria bacterium]|nr:glycosyltransferase family 2 protein [Candidatus Berkelbacteria bacterium]
MAVNLTVGILAKANDPDLFDCLSQLVFAAEVIVVVDGKKTDPSGLVASQSGAKVIEQKLESFADSRNLILTEAKYDWVLYLDTDERLTPELKKSIQEVVRNNQINGGRILRQDVFLGRQLRHGDSSIGLVRLGKKQAGKWVGRVHEVWELSGEVIDLTGQLKHFAHKSVASYLEKMEFYTDLEVKKATRPSAWWQLLVYPVAKFIKVYFVQLGILDGWPGLVFASLNARYSFVKRKKLLKVGE